MKKISILCFLLLVHLCIAQTTTPLSNIVVEKIVFKKAIIHFDDNTSVEGLGRLKTIFSSKEDVIIFKIEENDKDETWTVKDAKGITIISDDGVIDYEYLKVSKNSFTELYEVVTEGTVKLYKKRTDNYSSVDVGKVSFTEETPDNDFNIAKKAIYYLKKETEIFPTKIKDNYIKSTAEYMKDCEFIVERIKSHKYNYNQIKELVDDYNANCGE